jgi:hypothetical protein
MNPDPRLSPRWLHAVFLVVGAVAAFHGEAADCLPPPAGLIGWWPGDGSANNVAGTNNGSLQGGATASAAGVVGSGFGFDGTNGYVQVPDSPVLRPTNLTVEAWVRFDSLDSAGSGGSPPGQQYIVFKQNTRTTYFEGFFLGKGRYANRDFFVFGVSSASGVAPELDSVVTVTTGAWYHVAGVRGSNFIQLYVNGQFDSQTSVNFPQDYGNFPLCFGTSGQSYWDHKLNGALDEVSLHNRALSAEEIAAIYAAGGSGKCKVPRILTQPQGQSGYWGGAITLTAVAAGANPLSCQWQHDGLPVAGATSLSLVLTNLQVTDAGNYALVVTNVYGSVTSSPARLNIKVADVSIALLSTDTQNIAGLTIGGVANQTYGIQASAELGQASSWTGLTNLTLTGPTNVWYDPVPAAEPQRFYRVVPGPIPLP